MQPTDVARDHAFHILRVARVVTETADTRSYVLDIPARLEEVFRYRAGQFCTFRVRADGDEHMRCYSMSSAPEGAEPLTVTVKRVPGGRVSNWFHDHVRAGDEVEVRKPGGVFCVREGNAPILAFCGGSGITPVISIARSVLATSDRTLTLLYANRDSASVIFDAELADMAARSGGRLRVHHHLDSDGGFLQAAAISTLNADVPGADIYICGPQPFMDLVEVTLAESGADPGRLSIERFGAVNVPSVIGVIGTSDMASVADSGFGPDDSGDSGDSGDVGPSVPESVTLILKGRRTTVAYSPGDTVLETGRRGGLTPPFSCEQGNCATCMAIVRKGSARMRANNALTPEEVAEGWILTCQAIPEGESVTIEYESW